MSPKTTVHARPGDVITARMLTPAERAALGLPEGTWVFSVKRPGRAEELYDAGQAEIVIPRR